MVDKDTRIAELESLEAIIDLTKIFVSATLAQQSDTNQLLNALMTALFAQDQELCTTDQLVKHCESAIKTYRKRHGLDKLSSILDQHPY